MRQPYSPFARRALLIGIAAASIALASCSGKGAADQSQAGGASRTGQGSAQAGAAAGSQGAAGGRSGAGGGRRQAVVPVQATVAKLGLLTTERSTAGIVNPLVQSQVAAQVAGVVKGVLHLAGDWIKAGDVVVQLDDSQLRLTLANAQASLQNAQINLSMGQDNSSQANPKLNLQLQSAQSALDSAQKNYDAQTALFKLGGISAAALDSAASQLATAKANLEGAKTALDQNQKSGEWTIAQYKLAVTQAENQLAQAQLNLQNASIRAPFAGQISAVNLQKGMYASLNNAAFSIVSADRQISFSVPPAEAPYLAPRTKIRFDFGGKSYPTAVAQAPSAPLNGVVPLVAAAPGNTLPYGAVGNVTYTIPVATGILLPLAALQTLENHTYVFVIAEGRVSIKNVNIIGEAGITAVVEGLSDGEVVVVSPPPGLIQGSQVQAIMVQSSESQAPGAQSSQASSAAPSTPANPGLRQGSGSWQGASQGSGQRQGGTGSWQGSSQGSSQGAGQGRSRSRSGGSAAQNGQPASSGSPASSGQS